MFTLTRAGTHQKNVNKTSGDRQADSGSEAVRPLAGNDFRVLTDEW